MPLLNAAPTAGFDDPFDMLLGCHQRVRRFCALVERMAEHLAQKGLDEDLSQAAGSALRYFDIAARDHHADEEEDLFPALLDAARAAGHADAARLVERLTHDHESLGRLWADLRPRLVALQEGRPAELPATLASAFTGAYDAHIDEEEIVLIPLARRLLAPARVAAMGRAMAARRGVKPPVS